MKEADAQKRLGVSAEVWRETRERLEEGAHWRMVGRSLVVTPAGLAEAQRLLAGAADAASSPEPAAPTKPVETVARVLRADWANRRVVTASLDGAEIRIGVRDANLYVPGMLVPCMQANGDYYLATRSPRARGVM